MPNRNQIESNQIESNQIESNQIESNQIKSNQINPQYFNLVSPIGRKTKTTLKIPPPLEGEKKNTLRLQFIVAVFFFAHIIY
jgi:hypothetical protein